ncbi:MAG: serB [Aeromicrobium sp.]|nr:serB [Aeromicrobium sp.]
MTDPVPTSHFNDPTVLVTLTGPDQSGVTTRLFADLAPFGVEVIDVEQLVVRGRLILSALLTVPTDVAHLEAAVHGVGEAFGLEVTVEHGTGDNRARRVGRAQVVVLGSPLSPAAMAALAQRIKDDGGNIDRIVRMARYPVTAIRMEVSGVDPDQLQSDLAAVAYEQGVDVAVQENGILRHAQRLVVMDVDSTLIQGEVIEMIAAHAGCEAEVARITESAMRGELDFGESLTARVALLAGVEVSALDTVYDSLTYAPGARTMIRTLKRLGYRFALVSGGFTQIIERIAGELGIDYYAANQLEVADGRLTGRILGPVVDRAGKATALRHFAEEARIPVKNTVAIGDGANDLDMLAASGLGIASTPSPSCGTRPGRRSTCRTSTRSSTCSASLARRSRRRTPPTDDVGPRGRAAGRVPQRPRIESSRPGNAWSSSSLRRVRTRRRPSGSLRTIPASRSTFMRCDFVDFGRSGFVTPHSAIESGPAASSRTISSRAGSLRANSTSVSSTSPMSGCGRFVTVAMVREYLNDARNPSSVSSVPFFSNQ